MKKKRMEWQATGKHLLSAPLIADQRKRKKISLSIYLHE
jgi:hypothetical protein